MSVPASRQPRNGKWDVIDRALDSNARTFRLCLILVVSTVAPCLAAVAAALIHHMLL